MVNQLDALGQWTTVVADTGDLEQIRQLRPRDATTNPSLIWKAIQHPAYARSLHTARAACAHGDVEAAMDRLLVHMGCEILALIPGRVSTEVDARLSFDTQATVQRARRLVQMYRAEGIAAERVLIKIAATWEGIRAAEKLEREGIRTNLTLVFAQVQAIACGDAHVQLISPFVGRIYDWHKKQQGAQWDESEHRGASDPGVQSVRRIYRYFKHWGIATEIMGASFRSTEQILALAGCDLLTISPELMRQLQAQQAPVEQVLLPHGQERGGNDRLHYNEADFRYALNADPMATEKLAEGIRAFAADIEKLEHFLQTTI